MEAQSSHQETESTDKSTRKKRQTRKKAPAVVETPDAPNFVTEAKDQKIEPTARTAHVLEGTSRTVSSSEPPPQKKRQGRVGQRKPKRDPVGSCSTFSPILLPLNPVTLIFKLSDRLIRLSSFQHWSK